MLGAPPAVKRGRLAQAIGKNADIPRANVYMPPTLPAGAGAAKLASFGNFNHCLRLAPETSRLPLARVRVDLSRAVHDRRHAHPAGPTPAGPTVRQSRPSVRFSATFRAENLASRAYRGRKPCDIGATWLRHRCDSRPRRGPPIGSLWLHSALSAYRPPPPSHRT